MNERGSLDRATGLPSWRRVGYFVAWHLRILGWVVHYVVARRAWAMAPLIFLLILMGLVIFTASNPAVSPFLYALF